MSRSALRAPSSAPAASPGGLPLAEALGRSDSLTGLLDRVRRSRSWLDAVNHLLPEGVRAEVRAGPLDDTRWVLLVSNAACAAKLRQLLPALQDHLRPQGLGALPIRIKVLPRQ